MSLVLTRPICEEELFVAINELVTAIGLASINSISQIKSELLVKIFETIYGQKIKKSKQCYDKEAKIDVCQGVLDILCDEILLVPLNHISAEGLVNGSLDDIGNLVEILSTFYECITSSIIHTNRLPSFENSKLNDYTTDSPDNSDQFSVKENRKTINLEDNFIETNRNDMENERSLESNNENEQNIRIEKWQDTTKNKEFKNSNKTKKSKLQFNDRPIIISDSRNSIKDAKNVQKKTFPKKTPSNQEPKSFKKSKPIINDLNLFNMMLDNFPQLELSTEMMHVLWKRFSSQSARLKRALKEVENSKNVSQRKIDDVLKRQEILMEYIRKDSDHLMKMKVLESEKQKEFQVRSVMRDRRTEHARAYRYYNDMSVVNRSRMLSAQQREEAIFRKNFNECLNIQKEAVQDIIAHKKQKLKNVSGQRQDQLLIMEKRCQEKIKKLKEKSVTSENQEKKITKELKLENEKIKREMIEKIEREVKEIQQALWKDKSNLLYRSLDAESFKCKLEKAAKKYTANGFKN